MRLIQKISRRNLDAFLSEYGSSERVLDVGSGRGSSHDQFFPNRVTVDIDPDKHPQVVADAQHLPFPDGEFGLVLCAEMLEHVKEPTRVAAELMRVLRPDGRLLLTTRFVYPLHESPHDYWRFTRHGLRELFGRWRIVEIRSETRSFSALGALVQRVCYQSKLRGGRPTKLVLFVLAYLLDHLNFLITAEYGDIRKSTVEEDIMSTGLYVVVENSDIGVPSTR